MKKSLLTIILGLSVILTACSEEDINGTETSEADTQDVQAEEKSSNPRSNVTDEEKAEMKRKHEEQKTKEEQAAKEKQKVEEEAEAQAKAEEVEKLRKENEAKEKAEQEDAETIYLQIMRESVGSYVDIQFDKSNKIYTMTPTDQGLIDEISMLPLGIGHEDWGVLVDGMASMSNSGKDLVGEGYTINLVNPLNHENVILWIMDGEVIYNVIDDL